MEYFRKNPEKESLTGGCLGEERMMKFYRCKKCGKAVAVLGESGGGRHVLQECGD